MKFRNRRVSGFHACWTKAAKRAVSAARATASHSREPRECAGEQQGARVVIPHSSRERGRVPNGPHAGACPCCRKERGSGRSATSGMEAVSIETSTALSGGADSGGMSSCAASNTAQIALCCLRPCHRSARRVGTFAHRIATGAVGQQTGDLAAYRLGIAKWNQDAASVSQQFLGVPIGLAASPLDTALAAPRGPFSSRRGLGSLLRRNRWRTRGRSLRSCMQLVVADFAVEFGDPFGSHGRVEPMIERCTIFEMNDDDPLRMRWIAGEKLRCFDSREIVRPPW